MSPEHQSGYSDVSSSPAPLSNGRSMMSGTLNELESVRLSSVNSRATCITFHFVRQLPSTQDLLRICPSYPAQSVVVGPHQQLWCFLVYPTALDREKAEEMLDCSHYYRGGHVAVDQTRRLVPIAEADLEKTRELSSLAVHGISAGTSRRDLEKVFPGAVSITIARRGGSAFLRFGEREDGAEKEFLRAERTTVRGCRVEVMFGHSIQEHGTRRGVVGDLRGKIMLNREGREMAVNWSHYDDRDRRSGFELSRARSRSRSRTRRKCPSRRKLRYEWRSRSRSSSLLDKRAKIISRRSGESKYELKENINHRAERKFDNQKENNIKKEIPTVKKELRLDSLHLRRDLWDTKNLLAPALTSSPYKSSMHKVEMPTSASSKTTTPSNSPTPSPILRKSSPLKTAECSQVTNQPRLKSKLGECSSFLPKLGSGDFGPLYRVLVTQLLGVGLSGKLAHGRAADIVNVWAETGYKVDQLREVVARFKGRAKQREELSRIVKEKCKKKARKMKIDIGAMVDITIAYLESGDGKKQEVDSNNNSRSEFKELERYLKGELAMLGMKKLSVEEEVARVMQTLSELELSLGYIEAEYISLVGDSMIGGVAEFHTSLEKKLAARSFHSRYLSARLAAGLIMEFCQEKVGKVAKQNKKMFDEMDNILRDESDFIIKTQTDLDMNIFIQTNVLSIPPGYPRMVVVLSYRLCYSCRMGVEECKVLARAMVGVWINYGFDYLEMKDMYEKERMGEGKGMDNLSLMNMRRLLHCRLRAKIEQGFYKPKRFGLSKLIDLTIYYFENTF
eukprot:GFUD01027590.1.p1 GENE.GFUD01027590.1~~GFUD01027590.1.p1  ORF type:complete len:790 (+),score=229.78 GFUD01027590.1:53-2422(+)